MWLNLCWVFAGSCDLSRPGVIFVSFVVIQVIAGTLNLLTPTRVRSSHTSSSIVSSQLFSCMAPASSLMESRWELSLTVGVSAVDGLPRSRGLLMSRARSSGGAGVLISIVGFQLRFVALSVVLVNVEQQGQPVNKLYSRGSYLADC